MESLIEWEINKRKEKEAARNQDVIYDGLFLKAVSGRQLMYSAIKCDADVLKNVHLCLCLLPASLIYCAALSFKFII
jgi:hypothetical protein